MAQKTKKHLTLNIDSEIAEKAVADPDIQVSELTEKFLRAFTTTSKTEDDDKRYEGYQDLFKLMLPLLKKFKVTTTIGLEIIYEEPDWIGTDPDGNDMYGESKPSMTLDIHLEPDGRLFHEGSGEVKIKDINIEDFHRPQYIMDSFLDAIQEGVNYRKEQFAQIEMAKTIIDAITKGVISKTKSKGKGR